MMPIKLIIPIISCSIFVFGFGTPLGAQEETANVLTEAESSIHDFLESTQGTPRNDLRKRAEHLKRSIENFSKRISPTQSKGLLLLSSKISDAIDQDRYFDAIDLALDGHVMLVKLDTEPRAHPKVLILEIEGIRLTKFLEQSPFPSDKFESTVKRIVELWNELEAQVKVIQLSGAISETIAGLRESASVDNPSLRSHSIIIFYHLSKLLPVYWERNHTK